MRDHNSIKLFWRGVPVSSSRRWLEHKQDTPLKIPETKVFLFNAEESTAIASPVEVEQRLPALRFEVLDVLSLIQDQVFPILASKGLVILQHQLIGGDADMEGIGLGPTLNGGREGIATGLVREIPATLLLVETVKTKLLKSMICKICIPKSITVTQLCVHYPQGQACLLFLEP